MNKLKGQISKVKVHGGISQASISLGQGIDINCILIETPETASYLAPGIQVNVIFKETEVILAKGDEFQLSLQNRIPGKIRAIKTGELLCEVTVETVPGTVTAIVSRDSLDALGLKKGEAVMAMIKQNEVMLSE